MNEIYYVEEYLMFVYFVFCVSYLLVIFSILFLNKCSSNNKIGVVYYIYIYKYRLYVIIAINKESFNFTVFLRFNF